jgi:hypothetical protein
MKSLSVLVILMAGLLLPLAGCQEDAEPTGNLQLELQNVIGSESLQLGNKIYTNANGDTYTVSIFKYYISNLKLKKADGSVYAVPESYFLVDEEDAASKTITLTNVPAGSYTSLSFLIGVDSTRNTSGAQTGALDIMKGMFWSWNTGYIFVMMEGNSPQSTQPYNKLQFHIGGYKSMDNCIREVSPSLNGSTVDVRKGKSVTAHYKVDLSKIFGAPNPVSFAALSAVHGGPAAVKLADNYQTMFTLDHIHNEE